MYGVAIERLVGEQRDDYKAFLPKSVCHEWLIAAPELMVSLGRADRALGELNAFIQVIPSTIATIIATHARSLGGRGSLGKDTVVAARICKNVKSDFHPVSND